MNSEQWLRALEVFEQATACGPEERDAFLETAVGGEPALLAEVRSLLETHEKEPDYLERPAARLSELEEADIGVRDPRRIGPYRVIERIGVGGMGTVYLAERDDDQFRQRVAIKLVKRGMDSEQILARFRAERQILASLEHPCIARLFDGGIAEDGRPYFVLEYIDEALPIDRYCQDNGLSVAARLELFRQVCDAVQYAHRKLIVHRDLKPSNLLVSKDGQVKLLDFGIAKLLDPAAADVTQSARTHTEMRLLTPEYASPEQARGEPLATTSDVYSLGVVLYKLLTGEKPYRVSGAAAAVAMAVREQEPDKPSTVVRRGGDAEPMLSPGLLEGDLDNVVLMALRKEPEARYPSAEALSADIGRYLERRPVLARPQTVGYRVRRFVQRHAVAVALSGLATLFLVAGVAGTAWQGHLARQERDRARAEAEKAERVADVLVGLFDMSNPGLTSDANSMTVREFADRAQAELAGELEDQPEVLARLETVMGRLNVSLARLQQARPLFESALARQREAFPQGHLDLVETLHRYSGLLRALGELDSAEAAVTEALAVRRELRGEDDLGVADLLQQHSFVLGSRGDLDRAQEKLEEAYGIRRRLLPGDHPAIGSSLGALATFSYQRGEFGEAAELGRRALAIQRAAHGDVHQAVAHELNNLGAYHQANGDYQKALETHREALRVRTAVYGSEHPFVAFSLTHLGSLALLLGDPETAEERFHRALELRIAAHDRDHPQVGIALTNLGRARTARGELEQGRELLEEGVAIQRGRRARAARLAGALVALGDNQRASGLDELALESYREAAETRLEISGPAHPATAKVQAVLARSLMENGDRIEAEALLGSAIGTLEAKFPDGHLDAAPAYLVRGDLELESGRRQRAVAAYSKALGILETELPAGHERILAAREKLARVSG